MKFKYGNATITAKQNKQGSAIITDISFTIGKDKLNFGDLNYAKKVDILIGKLEKKAKAIFDKNSKAASRG